MLVNSWSLNYREKQSRDAELNLEIEFNNFTPVCNLFLQVHLIEAKDN